MSSTVENQPPSSPANSHLGNLILPLVILACTAVFFSQSLDFPPQEDVGAEVVPHLWAAFITAFCLYLVYAAIRRKGDPDPKAGKIGHVLLFTSWLVVYLFAASSDICYFVSTFIFLVISMYALTYRKMTTIFAVAMGWIVFSYVIFYRLLFIQLPMNELLKPLFEV
jgi:hypothetical protein